MNASTSLSADLYFSCLTDAELSQLAFELADEVREYDDEVSNRRFEQVLLELSIRERQREHFDALIASGEVPF